MIELLLATGNPGKAREFQELLAQYGEHRIRLIPVDPQIEETGSSYAENASLKAEAAAAGGRPALADDSGLEIKTLGGFPGLHSARIASTSSERIAIVLDRLAREGGPRPWAARFVCALALARPGRPTRVFSGWCAGEISPVGAGTKGFGYDPIFLVRDVGSTFAELTEAEKNRASHRGAAVRELIASGGLEGLSGP